MAGEFYWQVKQGQITFNEDYASGKSLLSSELAGKELTWSVGSKVDHSTVATAFKIKGRDADFQRADVTPFAGASVGSLGVVGWIIIVVGIVVLLSVMSRCSGGGGGGGGGCDPQRENCSSSRSGGSSYGGYSSGGGHK